MIALIQAYRKVLKDEVAEWVEATGRGGATTWDDYRRRIGFIQGLVKATELFNDIVKKHIDEEEDGSS